VRQIQLAIVLAFGRT